MTNAFKRWFNALSGAPFAVFLILFGCCLNVLTLEVMSRQDPGCGGLITFAQFVFIAAQSSVSQIDFDYKQLYRLFDGSLSIKQIKLSFRKPEIPFKLYVKLTTVFFAASILNNKALDYGISIPVHTVFRSSGLTATLLMGKFVYGIHYTLHQMVACGLVTLGILAVTLADAYKPKLPGCCDDQSTSSINNLINGTDFNQAETTNQSEIDALALMNWTIGISMMFAGLFLLAYLGHKQDQAYKVYGKHTWREGMFYTHLLSLPVFALAWRDMLYHATMLIHGKPAILTFSESWSFSVPLWAMLILNLAFQSVCIRGVYMLTTCTNALTLNLTITFRKLMSLLLSVRYFGNVFTTYHWAASSLVFLGVLVYSLDSKPSAAAKHEESEVLKETTNPADIVSVKSDLRHRKHVAKS